MSEEVVIYHFSVKNTFLEVCETQDVPEVPRKKSWSCGDPWPSGLIPDFSGHENCEKDQAETLVAQPEISKDEQKKLERHRKGRCTPCVFFASNRGCADSDCGFCHLAHECPQKRRPPKQLREACKAAVEMALREQDENARRWALQSLAAQDTYLHSFIIGQINMRGDISGFAVATPASST